MTLQQFYTLQVPTDKNEGVWNPHNRCHRQVGESMWLTRYDLRLQLLTSGVR